MNKKYELIPDTEVSLCPPPTSKLWRIKALRDINTIAGIVKKGDIGGLVESTKNLDKFDNSWIFDNAKVMGDAIIRGGSVLGTYASVSDSSIIDNNSQVMGFSKVRGKSIITYSYLHDNATVFSATVSGSTIGGNATVLSNMYIKDSNISGDIVAGRSFFDEKPIKTQITIRSAYAKFLFDLVSFEFPLYDGNMTFYREANNTRVYCYAGPPESFTDIKTFFEEKKSQFLAKLDTEKLNIPCFKYLKDCSYEKITKNSWDLTFNLLYFCANIFNIDPFKFDVSKIKTSPLYEYFFTILMSGYITFGSDTSKLQKEAVLNFFDLFPTDLIRGDLCFEKTIIYNDGIVEWISWDILSSFVKNDTKDIKEKVLKELNNNQAIKVKQEKFF